MTVVFVDTETTGLDPYYHEIWEVGLIAAGGAERRWFLPVDLCRADPVALDIGRFHQRHPNGVDYRPEPEEGLPPDEWGTYTTRLDLFARDFAKLTWGQHLAGAVISFDEERLRRLLRRNGQAPGWHYHLVDVEALAAGYLAHGYDHPGAAPHKPPWDSEELSQCIGVNPAGFDRHTALGDARWAKAIYEKVMGR